jgi:lactate dehydrogenase-like 2-hydroxyacid dehydrogenase
MTETQERPSGAATGDGPVVVIPEPIGIMDWSYEVERSMLEPLGIRLVIPADRAEAQAAMRTADVVFTSSQLTADDIATFDNAVGIVCYSVGMDYVDAKAAAAKGIPIWNCPT